MTKEVFIAELPSLPMAPKLEDVVQKLAYDNNIKNDPKEEQNIPIKRCPIYAKGIVRQLAQYNGLRLTKENDITRYIGIASLKLLNEPFIASMLENINKRAGGFRRPRSAMDLHKSLTSGFTFLNEEDPDNLLGVSCHFIARTDVHEKIGAIKAITGMHEKDIAVVLIYAFGSTTEFLEIELRRVAIREWVNFIVFLAKRAGMTESALTNVALVEYAIDKFKLPT